MTYHHHATLRLTPSNSPFFRSPTPRSPTKASRSEEPGLRLQKVIGTTTASTTGFDALPAASQFAYTAGAAAVLATVDQNLTVTQSFFRATPGSAGQTRDGNAAWPATPTPSEPRLRTVGSLKDRTDHRSPVSSMTRDYSDSPARTTSAKDRVKAATSVAISPNGKWLAVGETGYRPRVLLFSAKDGSSDTPVCAMAEHMFGVHALRFSRDSKYLASLGSVNDGFIYIWSIDERTGTASLFASNKCTTVTYAMAWLGRSIVMAGLRFVKVWRPDDDSSTDARGGDAVRGNSLNTPRPRTDNRSTDFGNSILSPKHRALAGKNSLLGDLLDATFTCIVPVSDCKAFLCTESGEICLLDDTAKVQSLTTVANAGIRITAARSDEDAMLHAAGDHGEESACFAISDLENHSGSPIRPRPSSASPTKVSMRTGPAIVALATLDNAIVEVTSDHAIRLSNGPRTDDNAHITSVQLPAHEDAVLGVQSVRSLHMPTAAFITFSAKGTVHIWDQQGRSTAPTIFLPIEDSPEMYGLPNELKAVATLSHGSLLVSGDKYGSLAVLDMRARQLVHQIRAHSAEVLDLLAFEHGHTNYVASASRDRTVQLFASRDGRLDLVQTMDEHAGAVTGLLMTRDGGQLLSCSSDRSIVVRKSVARDVNGSSTLAFVMLKAIALKSTITSMALTGEENVILASSSDRCIGKYNIKSGQAGFSFKCSDNEGGEAVIMSKISYSSNFNGNPVIAGISSSDKSLRLYSEYGSLIARDWGHTEGVTNMTFLSRTAAQVDQHAVPQIVTVAADSTVFLWAGVAPGGRRSSQGLQASDSGEEKPRTLGPLAPPLRRVLSHSEMNRFRRESSAEELGSPSPSAATAPSASPPKVRKKMSRLSLAQAPKLEPGHQPDFDTSRRRSLMHRSPSPPSPRTAGKRDATKRQTLGMSLRSKSSENVLTTGTSANGHVNGFGSLTSCTESVCRTLRAYRRKLSSPNSGDDIAPAAFRELEKELKLTVRAIGDKSQGKGVDEAMLTKLLDQASDRLVGMLDQKFKARVDGPSRFGNGDQSPSSSGRLEPPAELDEPSEEQIDRSDTAPGALETRASRP
ncbi:hypothetical protein DOTSEDRAFT_49173 [Dothistroma septosporum NZE10]|uniref:Uncharacterized protein n=1 Tax=Dothistroma septosporum (strain NZE10 / CBS 128990) TaxID=675120 RepID=N1PZ11_DOTSN|nr:hypothetical protein DOTSEDRAFT_49173 [Dothistroma septosporum NZE10]